MNPTPQTPPPSEPPSESSSGSSSGPPPSEAYSEWIVEAEAQTFERDVLARSLTIPVLLDFWAPWCGPCKTLGPELEKRAREGKGRFLLAKIDIDRCPELAQVFRVQAVPAVLAIVEGKLADGFQGALAGKELDAFLERVAPLGQRPPDEADRKLGRALELAGEGQTEEALGHLRELLRETPEHVEARLALAEMLLDAGKGPEASRVLTKLEGDEEVAERVRSLRSRIEFASSAGDLKQLQAQVQQAPEDHAARMELGRACIAAREHKRGLEHLIEVVRADPGGLGVEARKAMLETFDILGLEDPVANDYRFKLSLEIFS